MMNTEMVMFGALVAVGIAYRGLPDVTSTDDVAGNGGVDDGELRPVAIYGVAHDRHVRQGARVSFNIKVPVNEHRKRRDGRLSF